MNPITRHTLYSIGTFSYQDRIISTGKFQSLTFIFPPFH